MGACTFHLDKNALDEAFEQMADEEDLSDEEREALASKAAHVKSEIGVPVSPKNRAFGSAMRMSSPRRPS